MSSQTECKARIVANSHLNRETILLTLEAPQIASGARPGQFVNLACGQMLRRPIGIMGTDCARGLVRLGVRIQGEGTRWLADRTPGDLLSVLGPLGHGFTLDGARRIITVGGGTGVFPLFFVQQACLDRSIEAIAVCGYRSKEDSVLRDDYVAMGCRTLFAADAGDLDVPGHAADALGQLLQDLDPVPDTRILTCGPKPMMHAVSAVACQHGLPCQVSLEERMACGIGVCLVCACKVRTDIPPGETYQRCCVEGPVFDAEEVIW